MENKLFLRRLNIYLQHHNYIEDIETLDDAVNLYCKKVSQLLILGNILDKILISLEEMDIFLEYFHSEEWKKGINPNTDCYEVQLYTTLCDAANKYQDHIDCLTETFVNLLIFFLKNAPESVRAKCHLQLFDEDTIEKLRFKINIAEISKKVDDTSSNLSGCIEEDTALFGDYINSVV